MADESQKPEGPVNKLPSLPDGKGVGNYGVHIGFAGVVLALIEIFRDDPHKSLDLFAQFGPKYLLWAFIAYIIWDLARKAIGVLNKGADKIGLMAENTGKVAGAIQSMDTKGDRTADEMRRLCSFAASQSQRAVEISSKNGETITETKDLLLQLLGQQNQKAHGEG